MSMQSLKDSIHARLAEEHTRRGETLVDRAGLDPAKDRFEAGFLSALRHIKEWIDQEYQHLTNPKPLEENTDE